MEPCYKHLSADERNVIQRGLNAGLSSRQSAHRFDRCPSTVKREVARNRLSLTDDAATVGRAARARCRRGRHQLVDGTPLLQEVVTDLHAGWSPEQMAGRRQHLHPTEPAR
jgi:IS30 family transposase